MKLDAAAIAGVAIGLCLFIATILVEPAEAQRHSKRKTFEQQVIENTKQINLLKAKRICCQCQTKTN